jgi:hypothetical protein
MKTKHEMREAAIKRLQYALKHQPRGPLCADDVTEALVGDGWVESSVDEDAEFIIDLLTDDDEPNADEYIKLPRDENGEVIHLYDALAGYGYPDGGVVCKAIANGQMILVGRITDTYREWLLWDAYKCHHYKKPTIEDVLREFAEKVTDSQIPGTHPTYEEAIAEYAKRMQLKEETCE